MDDVELTHDQRLSINTPGLTSQEWRAMRAPLPGTGTTIWVLFCK